MFESKKLSLVRTLDGQLDIRKPIWLMRQAGRYLPEYKNTRAQAGSFLNLCYNSGYATEVTLQPLRRFDLDAAILFSDILVIPHAMGSQLDFVESSGPKLSTIKNKDDVGSLRSVNSEIVWEKLAPIFETVSKIAAVLPRHISMLGFCGAPWTVASYMIGGQSNQLHQITLRAEDNDQFVKSIIDKLIDVQSEYLIRQLLAGAHAVQIFESHASLIPNGSAGYRTWSLDPIRKMVSNIRNVIPDARIIVFSRGNRIEDYLSLVETVQPSAVGVYYDTDLNQLNQVLTENTVIQGNLSPDTLIQGGSALDKGVDAILRSQKGRRHIFNLGHGIKPETPIKHVEQMINRIRSSTI